MGDRVSAKLSSVQHDILDTLQYEPLSTQRVRLEIGTKPYGPLRKLRDRGLVRSYVPHRRTIQGRYWAITELGRTALQEANDRGRIPGVPASVTHTRRGHVRA